MNPSNHPDFGRWYPRCAALGLRVVNAGPGFDSLELEAAFGAARYAALMKTVKEMFSCGHRLHPPDYSRADLVDAEGKRLDLSKYEVPCVYAKDVEAFLAGEAK